jgi:hypothetical protein
LDHPHGLVRYREGELQAYVELRYGMRGIWVRPYIHPDFEAAGEEIVDLLMNLPSRRGRPVYVCVSAYQSWLENILDELKAEPSPQQVLMVKYLAVKKKLENEVLVPGLEAHPETFAFTDLESTENL